MYLTLTCTVVIVSPECTVSCCVNCFWLSYLSVKWGPFLSKRCELRGCRFLLLRQSFDRSGYMNRRVTSESDLFVRTASLEIVGGYIRERSMSATSASFPFYRFPDGVHQEEPPLVSFNGGCEYEETETESDAEMLGEETIRFDNEEELAPSVEHVRSQRENTNALPTVRVFYCFSFILLLLAFEKLVWPSIVGTDFPKRSTVAASFKNGLHALAVKFPNQPNQSWRVIAAAVTPLLTGRKFEPSVVLVLHDKAAHQTAACLVWQLGNLVNAEVQTSKNVRSAVAFVNCSEPPYILPQQGAVALHNRMNSEFGEAHNKVLILNEVERLPADAYRTLHTFSDSTAAPYKEVFIFLTVSCPSDTVLPLHDDLLMERCLYESWLRKKLQKERFAALVSRIAGSMVVVVSEAKPVDSSLCSAKE